MMFPKEGKYVCSNTSCGEEKEIGEKKESFKTESKAKETTIIS
ncbi:MAG: transcription factor S, partial [Candidatus Methanomethylophilaceae archaeon]|nr:transcription factor S [Candidatus Methanomethylophilaceae archaeon]